ncbi:homeobox and C2H2 transcription factor [Purpureocillium lavendulum]|uniref:Homeobox and C2H2 transcription factor n=1 Tax=Purpureocillium lavendulum TaxID=1247861 RepID=A0AB34FLY2_9HYPO|nr:homeobox and C2H2 transcription factor [Purpureocillium lavendulum]
MSTAINMATLDEKPTPHAGFHIDTANMTVPEKTAALSNATTVCPNSLDKTPSYSGQTTPRSENVNPFDTDVEAMVTNSSSDKCLRSSVVLTRKNDCQVWPGQDQWKQRAKAAKKQRGRGCTCMSRLSRRNRIAVKVMLVILVVGAAVAIGFGVSKPLGAPIWGDKSKQG